MKTVPLYGKVAAGRVALVDDEDYELVMGYRWNVTERGSKSPGARQIAYAIANTRKPDGRRTMIYMHSLVSGFPETDHKNHDGLDNQRGNLRDSRGGTSKTCASMPCRHHRAIRVPSGIVVAAGGRRALVAVIEAPSQ